VTLTKVRRERMATSSSPAGRPHLVPEVAAEPHRAVARHDAARSREDLYFENYVVTAAGLTPLKYRELLNEDQYLNALDEYGDDAFRADIGAEAIRAMLQVIDLNEERPRLREELRDTTSEAKRKKLVKRLKLVESFIESGARPE